MIKRWAYEMRDIWYEEVPQLENVIPHSRIEAFEEKLETLLSLCEDVRSDETNLYALAHELYEEWNEFEAITRNDRPVPIGGHRLPPLKYEYDALEPYISAETMRLHHDKHHQSYVDGLNKAELELKKARETGNYDLIKHWEREAAFHGAGHYLHSIFWDVMHPNGGGEPKGRLRQQIEHDFGSFQKMKTHFTEAANAVEGSGWALLVWSPQAKRLQILQAEKHQNWSQQDVIPLLVLDVWEHAYYLQYKNERKRYVENWWNVVYWPEVERRFERAKAV